ncbi:hypothetical protein E3N88_38809 [Mikania micrantha]|uniref:Uncharacterized protein n=1 Tax=Mikania micrantha TaxID=192012 RepID=A0A5N6LXL0_9ASTR|nr:hypothetical protein E3N88_38809 [Mikania micrantha]
MHRSLSSHHPLDVTFSQLLTIADRFTFGFAGLRHHQRTHIIFVGSSGGDDATGWALTDDAMQSVELRWRLRCNRFTCPLHLLLWLCSLWRMNSTKETQRVVSQVQIVSAANRSFRHAKLHQLPHAKHLCIILVFLQKTSFGSGKLQHTTSSNNNMIEKKTSSLYITRISDIEFTFFNMLHFLHENLRYCQCFCYDVWLYIEIYRFSISDPAQRAGPKS